MVSVDSGTNDKFRISVGIVTRNHFPRLGGMEFATHFLASALNNLPHTSVAVTCATMPEVPKDFPYSYPVYRARSFSIFTPYLYLKNIESVAKRKKINVLHGQVLHGGGASAVTMSRKLGLPVVITSHGSDVQHIPEIGYGARLDPELNAKARFSIRQTDRIVALSRMNRDMILDLGADPDKVIVIPNGCLYNEIQAVPFEDLRLKYNLKPDDFVLITVGRNSPIKRMDLLFQAFSLLKNESPRIKYFSVGPEKNLGELAAQYGLSEQVVLTGPIPRQGPLDGPFPPFPELINLYRASDLFISVSYMESFNLSALDALACGLPILVSLNQGIRDVIIEGETGFVFRDERPEALAETILSLSRKRQALRSRREEIRRSVAHLTWDNIAEQMREVYVSLLR